MKNTSNLAHPKIVRRPLHGVILLDKPYGISSNDALQKVKRLLRAEKAGHTGTLDPLATGVLPICLGAATKFSQLHLEADKTYIATAKLGQTTTTADAEGDVLQTVKVNEKFLTTAYLQQIAQQFQGEISQIPPMYSALKKDGKALYEYARQGVEVDRTSRTVHIYDLNLKHQFDSTQQVHTLTVHVRCSKGTYIRTLAQDIGVALGCGAHLVQLRRIQTGFFSIDQCVKLADLLEMTENMRLQYLQPTSCLLQNHQKTTLTDAQAAKFLAGMRIQLGTPNCPQVAVFAPDRALLGSAHIVGGELIATRLLNPAEIAQTLSQNNPSEEA